MSAVTTMDQLLQSVEHNCYGERCRTLLNIGRSSLRSDTSAQPPSTITAAPPHSSLTLQSIVCELSLPSRLPYHRTVGAYAVRGAFIEAAAHSLTVPDALCHAAESLLSDPLPRVAQLLMAPILRAHTAGNQPGLASFSPLSFLSTARLQQFKAFALQMDACGQRHELVRLYESHSITDPRKTQVLLRLLTTVELQSLPALEQAELDLPAIRSWCHRDGHGVAQYLAQRVAREMTESKMVSARLQKHVLFAIPMLCNYGNARHALELFTATAHSLTMEQGTLSKLLGDCLFHQFPVEVGTYLLDGHGSRIVASLSQPLNLQLTRRSVKRLKGQTGLVLRLIERQILCSMKNERAPLPREVRQFVYETDRGRLTDAKGMLRPEHVALLPRVTDRTTEARLHFKNTQLQDDPFRRIFYLCYLPFREAVKLADCFVRDNDAAIRQAVVAELVGSLRYFPEHALAALEFCVQRPKEQDPWRTEMFEAWGKLTPTFWCHLVSQSSDTAALIMEKMLLLMEATHAAKDVSSMTLSALGRLLYSLVGPLPDFAIPQLVALVKKHQMTSFLPSWKGDYDDMAGKFPTVIPRYVHAMLGLTQDMLTSSLYHLYVAIVQGMFVAKQPCFVRQLVAFGDAALMETLKSLLRAGMACRNRRAASTSFAAFAKRFPRDVPTEISVMLREQLDFATEENLQRIVCRCLQGAALDLLVRPIAHMPIGRFYETEDESELYLCRLLLPCAHRWTAQQQQTRAQSILRVLCGPEATCGTSFEARELVRQLGDLPSAPCTLPWIDEDGKAWSLLTLATEPHKDHGDYLRGFALQALGQRDGEPEAVQTLLAALSVSGTRVDALRALSRTLRRASTAEAIALMDPILQGTQVTAQKEALRLLGSKRDALAYDRLVAFAAERRLPMPEKNKKEEEENEESARHTVEEQAKRHVSTQAASKPMHPDVRTALVATLFDFIDRPQVWDYYDCLLAWDCAGEDAAADQPESEEGGEDDGTDDGDQEEEEEEEEYDVDDEDEDRDAALRPSQKACMAMPTLPWTAIRLPWQLARYQTLLTGLLQHPSRPVQVAALNTLASAPPYASLELCQAAAAYLDDYDNRHVMECALQCMVRCVADEATAFVTTRIAEPTGSDVRLAAIVNALAQLTSCADVNMLPLFHKLTESVLARLFADRRQPRLMVRCVFALPLPRLVPCMTQLVEAGVMHTGAAYAAVEAVRTTIGHGGSAMQSVLEAEAVAAAELHYHESALLRRVGLEIHLQARRQFGWTGERRVAVMAYQQDEDMWVADDAKAANLS